MKKIEFNLNNIKPSHFSDEKNNYSCEICHDNGFYFKGDIAYTCECRKKEMLNVKKLNSGLTPLMIKHTFDSFDLSYYNQRGESGSDYRKIAEHILLSIKNSVKEIVKGQSSQGILIQGSVGSGKTFLAAACANYLIENGINVKFIIVPDFLELLRDTFNSNSDEREAEVMNEIKTADVLILDDLGAHNYTDWSVNTIFSIINYRVNFEKPVIVTTNLSSDELENKLGSRIASRLTEVCRYFRLENNSDNRLEGRRRELAERKNK